LEVSVVSLEAGLQPIPGYRLTRPLGAGAFGDVWEAKNEAGDALALKFLDCRKRDRGMVNSEIRLLQALAELKHPHIIPMFGIHANTKYLIIAMERAEGSLSDLHQAYLEETGENVPPDHALDLLAQAADALDYLAAAKINGFPSARGLQHCDVKPSNLLLVGNTVKVADFGLCSGTGIVTHHNSWKGTIPYAAPELFKGAAAPGTDQYALAITFCELVMGARPFWSAANVKNSPTGIPIDLTKLREKEYPVIAKALHPYAGSRFPTCKAFIQALRKIQEPPRRGSSIRIFPKGLLETNRYKSMMHNGLSDTWRHMMAKPMPATPAKQDEPRPDRVRR
jgi:serine/threonine protein kinase